MLNIGWCLCDGRCWLVWFWFIGWVVSELFVLFFGLCCCVLWWYDCLCIVLIEVWKLVELLLCDCEIGGVVEYCV